MLNGATLTKLVVGAIIGLSSAAGVWAIHVKDGSKHVDQELRFRIDAVGDSVSAVRKDVQFLKRQNCRILRHFEPKWEDCPRE